MAISAFVFDIDDTLVDLFESKQSGYAWISSRGYDSALLKNVEADLWHRFALGEITRQELGSKRWEAINLPITEHSQFEREYELLVDDVRPLPGAIETIDYLRSQGYKVGILSNATAVAQRVKIDRIGILERTDAILTSEELGFAKPDRRAFEAIASALGVACNECVMVGDNLQFDVLGAINAGFANAVWTPCRKTFSAEQIEAMRADLPHPSIDSLFDLVSTLDLKERDLRLF